MTSAASSTRFTQAFSISAKLFFASPNGGDGGGGDGGDDGGDEEG